MRRSSSSILLLIFVLLFVSSLEAQPIPSDDLTAIERMLSQVDVNAWFNTIRDLAYNDGYRSRFCLRVDDYHQAEGQPKPDGACDNAARYILERFRSYGLEAEMIPFKHRVESLSGELLGEYTLHNVVATLPGKGPDRDKEILLTAHYDSIASHEEDWKEHWNEIPAPGATDNGSGVAMVLEVARILSRYDFDYTIKFIAFSGEELGLFGSRDYSKHAADRDEPIAAVLNVDMLGHDEDGALDVHVVTNERSSWIGNVFVTAKEAFRIGGLLKPVVDPKFVWSDHSPFWKYGYSAAMISEESDMESPEWPQYIHSSKDVIDNINLGLGRIGLKLVLSALALLADPIPADRTDVAIDSFALPRKLDEIEAELPISVDVVNLSQNEADDLKLHVYALTPDGQRAEIAERSISLGPGERRRLNLSYRPSEWGRYRIRAFLNLNLGSLETDFGNNFASGEVEVRRSPAVWGSATVYPNPYNGGRLRMAYQLSSDADVFVKIYDLTGHLIGEREFVSGTKGGLWGPNDVVIWDGKNRFGEKAASGIYLIHLIAVNQHGSVEIGRRVCLVK